MGATLKQLLDELKRITAQLKLDAPNLIAIGGRSAVNFSTAALQALLGTTNTTLSSILSKIIVAPATEALQNTLNTLVSTLDSVMDLIKTDTTVIASDTTEANTRLTSLQGSNATIASDTTEANTRLSSLQSNTDGLEALLTTIRDDVAQESGGALAAIQTAVEDLENNFDILGSMGIPILAVAATALLIEGSLNTIITHVDGVESRLDTMIGHIDGVEGKQDTGNANIANMETMSIHPNIWQFTTTYTCSALGTLILDITFPSQIYEQIRIQILPTIASAETITIANRMSGAEQLRWENAATLASGTFYNWPNTSSIVQFKRNMDRLTNQMTLRIALSAVAVNDIIVVRILADTNDSSTPTVGKAGSGGTFTDSVVVNQVLVT